MSNGNTEKRATPKQTVKVAEQAVPQAAVEVTKLLADLETEITASADKINGAAPAKDPELRREYEFEAAFKRAGDLMVEAFQNNVNNAQGALEEMKATVAKLNEGVKLKAEQLASFETQMGTLRTEAEAAFKKNMDANKPE